MNICHLLYAVIIFHGTFEYRTENPDALFPTLQAVYDYSSPAVMMNPAQIPLSDRFIFNSNGGRPYSEKELMSGGAAVQYGSTNYGLQIFWNSFGADFYREHTFSLKAAYSIFSFFNIGISENLYILKIAADELSKDWRKSDTDISLLFSPYQWLNFAFTQTGIVSLINEKNDDILYNESSVGVLFKPGKGFSIAWNNTDTAIERVNIFTVSINPTNFITLKGGYCKENSSFSTAMGILASDLYISYGLKYHPFLGYSHSVGISYAIGSGIESLDYKKPLFSSDREKININRATLDDLKAITGLSDVSAERIILYREKIGPVTDKALMQIGLTSDEIKIIKANVYGIERASSGKDGEKNFKKFVKSPPRQERIKTKFQNLIKGGIQASTAIKYSELSESVNKTEFRAKLQSDNSLSSDQKKAVERICIK
ncbi:MAG: helix-hairpin-helix domain-containing protein [Leptospirales bacterium]|nr:helix-hairpin-helix domain-containing protein [Leptospirales bacterium]